MTHCCFPLWFIWCHVPDWNRTLNYYNRFHGNTWFILSNSLTVPQGPALQFLYTPRPSPNLVLFTLPSRTSTPQAKTFQSAFPGGSSVKNPPTTPTQVRSLVREDPTCWGAIKPELHNYCAWVLEPSAPQEENPPQGEACPLQPGSSPSSPHLEKRPHSSEDPARPKKNLSNLLSDPKCEELCVQSANFSDNKDKNKHAYLYLLN